MKRRKIDTRTISSRRPTLNIKENITADVFASSIKRFADEYLRAAMMLTVCGHSAGVVNVSLEDTAYMLRLFVEYGGCDSILDAAITIDDHMTLQIRFTDGIPRIDDLTFIARAARNAGFFFEVRSDKIICRTGITSIGRVPVYFGENNKFYDCIIDMFFS